MALDTQTRTMLQIIRCTDVTDAVLLPKKVKNENPIIWVDCYMCSRLIRLGTNCSCRYYYPDAKVGDQGVGESRALRKHRKMAYQQRELLLRRFADESKLLESLRNKGNKASESSIKVAADSCCGCVSEESSRHLQKEVAGMWKAILVTNFFLFFCCIAALAYLFGG